MHQGPMNSCAKGFQHISNGFRATAVQSPILDLAIFLWCETETSLILSLSPWVKVGQDLRLVSGCG